MEFKKGTPKAGPKGRFSSKGFHGWVDDLDSSQQSDEGKEMHEDEGWNSGEVVIHPAQPNVTAQNQSHPHLCDQANIPPDKPQVPPDQHHVLPEQEGVLDVPVMDAPTLEVSVLHTLTEKPKRKTGACCAVVGCPSVQGRDKHVSFFRFPARAKDKREAWIIAVKRRNNDASPWVPGVGARVCALHFLSGKASNDPSNPDWCPSLFPTQHRRPATEQDLARHLRYQKRNKGPAQDSGARRDEDAGEDDNGGGGAHADQGAEEAEEDDDNSGGRNGALANQCSDDDDGGCGSSAHADQFSEDNNDDGAHADTHLGKSDAAVHGVDEDEDKQLGDGRANREGEAEERMYSEGILKKIALLAVKIALNALVPPAQINNIALIAVSKAFTQELSENQEDNLSVLHALSDDSENSLPDLIALSEGDLESSLPDLRASTGDELESSEEENEEGAEEEEGAQEEEEEEEDNSNPLENRGPIIGSDGNIRSVHTHLINQEEAEADENVLDETGEEENDATQKPDCGPDISTNAHFQAFCGTSLSFHNFLCKHLSGEISKGRTLSAGGKLKLYYFKLRHNLPFKCIGVIFNLSAKTVSKYYYEVSRVLTPFAKKWTAWLPKGQVKARMPADFKAAFPNCRVIIDASEVKIESPMKVDWHLLSYSQYKSGTTIKFLIGIAPDGCITFLSKAYGGRTTDGQLTNESGILELLEPGDLVLADKGFPGIVESSLRKGVFICMPTFKQGDRQFTTSENEASYACAKYRIHVERAIGRMKQFFVLKHLDHSLLKDIDNILPVIAFTCNCFPDLIVQKE